jgi:hypothetical protein
MPLIPRKHGLLHVKMISRKLTVLNSRVHKLNTEENYYIEEVRRIDSGRIGPLLRSHTKTVYGGGLMLYLPRSETLSVNLLIMIVGSKLKLVVSKLNDTSSSGKVL